MDNQVVNFIWIGEKLNDTGIRSIRSFMDQGHVCRLWSWDMVERVPAGVHLVDANSLGNLVMGLNIPHFTDYMRLKLIYNHGGWYSDLDNMLLKPLDFEQEHVFAAMQTGLNNNIFKAPQKSECVRLMIETCDRMLWKSQRTGFIRKVMLDSIMEAGLGGSVHPRRHFNPLPYDLAAEWLNGRKFDLNESYCVHLFESFKAV